jgi:metal-sulfur cluster biosynthetic enzyme
VFAAFHPGTGRLVVTELTERVRAALRAVIDPEVGVNIVDLGLIYELTVDGGEVHVALTMTSPACPLGEGIVRDAERCVRAVPGVSGADVRLVWRPPWGPERMSAAARRQLGWPP